MFRLAHIQVKDILRIDHLTIPKGITCIVGESGAGKSTLLRLLNKMTPLDHGTIYYNGTSLADLPAVSLRRRVVMLSQTPHIFPGTIRENLLIGLRFAEMPEKDDARLQEALISAALAKPLEAGASSLSGGEKQRLALARALLLEPEVLLLDEPSSALDEQTETRLFYGLTKPTASRRCNLVMVTHSQALRAMADTIITLDKGAVINLEEVTSP